MVGVDRGDHHEAHNVVNHCKREDEAAQSFGRVFTEESEQAEGERRIGRHSHAPSVYRGPTRVDRQVEPDSAKHPAKSGQYRKNNSRTLTELADVEFPPCLEA